MAARSTGTGQAYLPRLIQLARQGAVVRVAVGVGKAGRVLALAGRVVGVEQLLGALIQLNAGTWSAGFSRSAIRPPVAWSRMAMCAASMPLPPPTGVVSASVPVLSSPTLRSSGTTRTGSAPSGVLIVQLPPSERRDPGGLVGRRRRHDPGLVVGLVVAAGCPAGRRLRLVPGSKTYPFQLTFAASSWLNSVGTSPRRSPAVRLPSRR